MPWKPNDKRPEMAASLIGSFQATAMGASRIPLYPGRNGGTAGLILRPGVAKVSCGKPVDSVGTCKGECTS